MIFTRKSIRLRDYNYSQCGCYFITICIKDRKNSLGAISDGQMSLNRLGKIAEECIIKIPALYEGIEINCMAVMPNHVHILIESVGVAYHATRNEKTITLQEKSKMLIPKIIQQFKTATVKLSKNIGGLHDMQPLQWQRGYYEHVIRNEKDYFETSEYIMNNPASWGKDQYYFTTADCIK